MTSPQRRSLRPADASVLLAVHGVPSWGAILIAVVFGIAGLVVGRSDGTYTVGWLFGIVFIVGIALGVLAVRRGSLFTAMVQAPILMTILVFVAFRLLGSQGTIYTATKIVASFPVMAVATGVGLLLGLVRIIAQPVGRTADVVYSHE